MGICSDLLGKKFNRLQVIERLGYNKHKSILWKCLCDCGNYVTLPSYEISSGRTKSCGCYKADVGRENGKKYIILCTYDLSGEYGIGYTKKGEEFYFDLEDYEKIKDRGWLVATGGYIRTRQKDDIYGAFMHHIVFGIPSKTQLDHINRNPNDNRKANLRLATSSTNTMNRGKGSNNTSGTIGVSFSKEEKKWTAYIQIEQHTKNLGLFLRIEDAIKARLGAEKEYYGEFAPQQHLYAQYGIV
jgi:hypothetical protein